MVQEGPRHLVLGQEHQLEADRCEKRESSNVKAGVAVKEAQTDEGCAEIWKIATQTYGEDELQDLKDVHWKALTVLDKFHKRDRRAREKAIAEYAIEACKGAAGFLQRLTKPRAVWCPRDAAQGEATNPRDAAELAAKSWSRIWRVHVEELQTADRPWETPNGEDMSVLPQFRERLPRLSTSPSGTFFCASLLVLRLSVQYSCRLHTCSDGVKFTFLMSSAVVLAFSIRETVAEKDSMTKLQLFHDASSPAKLEGFRRFLSTRMSTIEADEVVVTGVAGTPAAVSRAAIVYFAACSAVPACCSACSSCSSRSSDVAIVSRIQSKPTPQYATRLRNHAQVTGNMDV